MYSITSMNVGHRGSARASRSNTGSCREPAIDRSARPAARRNRLGTSVTSEAIQDERVGADAVRRVVRRRPFGTSLEELTEGARLAAAGVSMVEEPVVEQQHRPVLQRGPETREHVAGGLVEVTVEMH